MEGKKGDESMKQMKLDHIVKCHCGNHFPANKESCPNCGSSKYKIFHERGDIKMYKLFPKDLYPERVKA